MTEDTQKRTPRVTSKSEIALTFALALAAFGSSAWMLGDADAIKKNPQAAFTQSLPVAERNCLRTEAFNALSGQLESGAQTLSFTTTREALDACAKQGAERSVAAQKQQYTVLGYLSAFAGLVSLGLVAGGLYERRKAKAEPPAPPTL